VVEQESRRERPDRRPGGGEVRVRFAAARRQARVGHTDVGGLALEIDIVLGVDLEMHGDGWIDGRQLRRAERAAAAARDNLELRREAYRTALDEGRQAPALRAAYQRSQRRLAQAERERRAAAQAVAEAQPSAFAAQREIAEVQQGRFERRELLAFVFRLAFVLATVAFGYWLLARLRRRGSRYYAVGIAVVAFAAILAFAMAVDFLASNPDEAIGAALPGYRAS
jgi:hypothetical protein